jgi:hypothetical protein
MALEFLTIFYICMIPRQSCWCADRPHQCARRGSRRGRAATASWLAKARSSAALHCRPDAALSPPGCCPIYIYLYVYNMIQSICVCVCVCVVQTPPSHKHIRTFQKMTRFWRRAASCHAQLGCWPATPALSVSVGLFCSFTGLFSGLFLHVRIPALSDPASGAQATAGPPIYKYIYTHAHTHKHARARTHTLTHTRTP